MCAHARDTLAETAEVDCGFKSRIPVGFRRLYNVAVSRFFALCLELYEQIFNSKKTLTACFTSFLVCYFAIVHKFSKRAMNLHKTRQR